MPRTMPSSSGYPPVSGQNRGQFRFALLEAEMVMAQLLSCYAISLPVARPVLPVGRVTIEPSYEPLFRLDSV